MDRIFMDTQMQSSAERLKGFKKKGIIVEDFRGGTGRGREWDSSSNKTMLGVIFGSFFVVEESTQFRIMENIGSDEVAP